jgi:hypothetical protein
MTATSIIYLNVFIVAPSQPDVAIGPGLILYKDYTGISIPSIIITIVAIINITFGRSLNTSPAIITATLAFPHP